MKILLFFTLGVLVGYIIADLLQIENKVTLNVKKQKIKGKGNTLNSSFRLKDLINRRKKRRLHKNKK